MNGTISGVLDKFGFNTLYGVGTGASTSSFYNSSFGYLALASNSQSHNTAVGAYALNANTSGSDNSSLGSHALAANTSGTDNTAAGYYSMANNTTGYENSAFGEFALNQNVTGIGSCAFGQQALGVNTASFNNAFGFLSLDQNTTGTPNCAFGVYALWGNTTGSHNVGFGDSALYYNATGSQNSAFGDFAGPGSGSTNLSNTGAYGYGATVTASNSIVFGNASITSIGGQVGWTSFSDGRYKKNVKEDIPGLAFIKLLRPVTYNLEATTIDAATRSNKQGPTLPNELKALKAKEQVKYSGFIAQEVEASAKQLGFEFSGVKAPQNDKDFYGLRYGDFVVPLVKAVQELSKTNDSLKTTINDLTTRLNQIQEQLKKVNALLITGDIPSLKQNSPNPFSKNSLISYYLPSKTRNAVLTITDVDGKVLKNVVLKNSKGPGQAVINAGTLPSGVYYYSLQVNGKYIDTKTMVLAK